MPAVAEKENTLVSQLEKTLRSRASHLAIKSKSSELTYADLDNLSARCASALLERIGKSLRADCVDDES